jgi:hypothetical protein
MDTLLYVAPLVHTKQEVSRTDLAQHRRLGGKGVLPATI